MNVNNSASNVNESMNNENIVPIDPIPRLQGVSVSSLNPCIATPERNTAHIVHNIAALSPKPIAQLIPIRKYAIPSWPTLSIQP